MHQINLRTNQRHGTDMNLLLNLTFMAIYKIHELFLKQKS